MDDIKNTSYLPILERLSDKSDLPPFEYFDFYSISKQDKIIQINLEVKLKETLIVKFKINWDLSKDNNCPEIFSEKFVEKIKNLFESSELMENTKRNIVTQIYDQIISSVCKLNRIPKFKIIKVKTKEETPNPLKMNDTCDNCGFIKYNNEYCINCNYCFIEENETNQEGQCNNLQGMNLMNVTQTDRLISAQEKNENQKRVLNLRQRGVVISKNKKKVIQMVNNALMVNIPPMTMQSNINIGGDNINDDLMGDDENNEKEGENVDLLKTIKCKKCGERNPITANECKKCKIRFPRYATQNKIPQNTNAYCLHFWTLLIKNHIISQLKDFSSNFKTSDFCCLKFLYSKVKDVMRTKYKKLLTDDAYFEVKVSIELIHNLFRKPNIISQRAYDKSYKHMFGKERPKANELNFNNLTEDIKEGWMEENEIDFKSKVHKKRKRIYDNIARNPINELDEEYLDDDLEGYVNKYLNQALDEERYGNSNDNLEYSRKKRGRPKKNHIFRNNSKNKEEEKSKEEESEEDKSKSKSKNEDIESEETRKCFIDVCAKNNIDWPEPKTTARLIDRLASEYVEPKCVN
ncbi:MAG: hypothetical protein MJ252_06165, partial [archaeon]|nr:hypothetical protein [archaeon]